MAYRTRSVRRIAKKTRRKFFFNVIIVLFLCYATLQWILPNVIGGVGFLKGIVNTPKQAEKSVAENPSLAPPVFSIPYEATNSAKIEVKGYATSGSKVKVFLDDKLLDTVSVFDDGEFIIKNVELQLGNNIISGKTLDQLDQESLASKTVIIILDLEKPTLKITEPEDGKTIQGGDRRVTVSGTTDPDAQVLINGSRVIVNSDGNFNTTIQLNDGENILNIKALDKATNSTETSRKVTFTP